MTTHDTTDRVSHSNVFARQRDGQIRWLLERHPATAAMLVGIGFFQTKGRASKRLRRLVEKKQLRLAGTVALRDGRPEHVYCRGRFVKADNVLHEVQLSQLCFRLHADEIRRGPEEVDAFLLPDAEVLIDGRGFGLELDRGTSSFSALTRTRLAKYQFSNLIVLWVCPTLTRMEGLRQRSAMLRGKALFTTLEQALRDPHAPGCWMDIDGTRTTLPRARQGSGKGEIKS